MLADQVDAPMLRAAASQATGAVLLSEGGARAAIVALRDAAAQWRDLDAPYEMTRARVLLGVAFATLGDDDSAELELAAARETFERLGAAHDAARLGELTEAQPATRPAGLTDREIEVLALVAAGETNRAVAARLNISEHTVARHVQNIFTKIGVSTRAAAGAFAFEHGLA
jgi:DNA-binding NarL/FixJ family response regulator